MAKNGKGGDAKLVGPLTSKGSGNSLGYVKPASTPEFSAPDPLGLTHGTFRRGPSGQSPESKSAEKG